MKCRAALAAAWLLFACGCASVRMEHGAAVGTAGAAWGRAMDSLLLLAEETAVDADSARALSEGQGLSREDRRAVLEKHAGVEDLISDLERLRRHARLLTRYFEGLRELADPAADRAASDAAAKAADAAGELGRELAGSKLLSTSERDLLSKTAGLLVRGVREGALDREVAARASAVGHELAVQKTLLDALRREIRADALSLRELGRQRDVARPYLENRIQDSAAWIAHRRLYTLPPAVGDILADASDTASRLRSAWAALAEGRLDGAAWSVLLADADTLASWVRAVRDARS
ncbi:MAG: hypothetical protein LC796_07955 [Acidobacteria bacterium]|nr:hypothetical protein [Acidobacteriota bacterium]